MGVEIPAGKRVRIVEDTTDTMHVVLPVSPPAAEELSREQLQEVAGDYPGTNPGDFP